MVLHAAGGALEQAGIKSAAALDSNISTGHPFATTPLKEVATERPWYEQERLSQHSEPEGGATTSTAAANKPRDRVKFAAGTSCDGDSTGKSPAQLSVPQHVQDDEEGGSTPVAIVSRTGFFSFTHKHAATSNDEGTASHSRQPGDASFTGTIKHHFWGGLSRANSHTAAGQHRVGFESSAEAGSGDHGRKSEAVSDAGSRAHSEAPSRSQSVAASGMSATLKGLFGGASSKLFGSLMGRGSGSNKSDSSAEEQEELWFTSLDDFKPICHMLHRGRYMTAYFACANKTGQHFLLKKFDKHKMLPAEERGVRRAIAFSELLKHPNLVRMMGTWESDDIIFVVEEYVGKGDILNDCISHPDKYTERHVAVCLAKPLLQALAHLHDNNIIHRSVLPENAYMGLDDVLRLGHLSLAIDQTSDRPKSRTTLLDYMAPEMLSIRPLNEHELALLNDDSDDGSSSSLDDSGAAGPAQQQQQYWESLHAGEQQQQVPRDHLGLLGPTGPFLPTAAAVKQHADEVLLLDEAETSTLHHQQQQGHAQHSHRHHQQHQQGSRVQQSAELEPSRQASLDPTALEQLDEAAMAQCNGLDAGAAGPDAAFSRLMVHSKAARCVSRAFMEPCRGSGRAEWEYQDHYDEKIDIWQLGCMLHELLCGSMPFELDSKLESAGLALWADIEVLPGSVPPDCSDFIQQALTKNPRMRPSAQQLLQHPWLARCQAGEPWRDPIELEAARREAELATLTGWIRYHWASATAAVSNALRGGRVVPMQASSSKQSGDATESTRQSLDAAAGFRHSLEAGAAARHSQEAANGGKRSQEAPDHGKRSPDAVAGARHPIDAAATPFRHADS